MFHYAQDKETAIPLNFYFTCSTISKARILQCHSTSAPHVQMYCVISPFMDKLCKPIFSLVIAVFEHDLFSTQNYYQFLIAVFEHDLFSTQNYYQFLIVVFEHDLFSTQNYYQFLIAVFEHDLFSTQNYYQFLNAVFEHDLFSIYVELFFIFTGWALLQILIYFQNH